VSDRQRVQVKIQWRPFDEETPGDDTKCVVLTRDGQVFSAVWDASGENNWFIDEENICRYGEVSHWAPLSSLLEPDLLFEEVQS